MLHFFNEDTNTLVLPPLLTHHFPRSIPSKALLAVSELLLFTLCSEILIVVPVILKLSILDNHIVVPVILKLSILDNHINIVNGNIDIYVIAVPVIY